jgi:hypothetical protein
MTGVRHFRNIFFTLAAFLWLPASAHCELETIPGFEFLRCSIDASILQGSDDCAGKGCCAVEKSQYLAGEFQVTLPAPDLLPMLPASIANVADTLPAEVSIGIFTAAPPQSLHTWQFVARTALAPRAPSLAL